MLTKDDGDLILFLAAGGAGCSLDSSPGKNWVEKSGGLPNYICKIAKGIMRSGKSKSSAIAIAVSRVKAWAAGGDDVDPDTRAKAAAAVAQWEKLKGKNKAKKLVKATTDDGSEYIMLSERSSYNTEMVRRAWDAKERERRQSYEAAHPGGNDIAGPASQMYPYSWIRELWSDYIVVEIEGGEGLQFQKIPYSVQGADVNFGAGTEVKQVWIETEEDSDDELSELEREYLGDVLVMSQNTKSYLQIIADMKNG